MEWIDTACIIFACVTAIHLGLIGKIEEITGEFPLLKKFIPLPIISCPKCFTFWVVLAYGLWAVGITDMPQVLAVSFLSSYAAIWLELFEGIIDKLYMKLYDKVYPTTNTADD